MKRSILYSALLFTLSFSAFAQRKVLIEQFTNSGCPSCAGNTPVVAAYVNANLNDVIMLAYHTSFPYFDSMYHENSFQSGQRVAFYNIGAVPFARVDGNFFVGNLVSSINTTIPNAGAVVPRYNISFANSNLNGNVVNASVLFESTNAANNGEPLKAMIVLAEKKVLKNAYVCCAGNNSETEYPWVVRRMLPDETGTTLVNTNINGSELINVSWNTTNIKDFNELRIIAFVQNTTTKAIYQSEISTPSSATGISQNNISAENLVSIAYTPSGNILIHFNQPEYNHTLKIIDVIGKTIYQGEINNISDKFIDATTFPSGIYFIQVSNKYTVETKNIFLSH